MKQSYPSSTRSLISFWKLLIGILLLGGRPAAAQLTNDECAQAISVPVAANCALPVTGTLQGATQSLPPGTCGFGAPRAYDVWYQFVASGNSQEIRLTIGFPAVLEVRAGSCTASTAIFCNTISANYQPVLVGGLTGGQTYFIRIYDNNGRRPPTAIFTLCVGPAPQPPANDECAGAILVPVTSTCAAPVAGDIATATQSLPATATCGSGPWVKDVWYRFVATAAIQHITLTANFSAVMDVRTGTCSNSTSIYCDSYQSLNHTVSADVAGLTAGQTYYLRVYQRDHPDYLYGSTAFQVCITPGASPVVANDECANAVAIPVTSTCATPISGTVANATQSLPPVTADPNVPQALDVWYSFVASGPTQLLTLGTGGVFGGVVDVRTGTCASSSSIFSATVLGNAGTVVGGLVSGQTYFLRVYGLRGSTTFTLCVSQPPAPPANDDCANAPLLPVTAACATPTAGTVAGASQSLPTPSICGMSGIVQQDVWYRFVATGSTQLVTVVAAFATGLDVRTATCATSTKVFCAALNAYSYAGTVVSGLAAGQTYFLRIYANVFQLPTPANSTFTVCINPGPPSPANDDCDGAVVVPITVNCNAPVHGTLVNSGQSLPATLYCDMDRPASDVWYQFVATETSHIFTLTGPQFSPVLDLRTGVCSNSTSLFCYNDSQPTTISGLTVGQTYFIRVYSFFGGGASFTLCITPGPSSCAAPGALAVPSLAATTAQLSWQPGGTPPAGTTYTVEYGPQGFLPGTGTLITGIANPGLQLTGLTASTAYCYYVRQQCPGTAGSSTLVGPACFQTALASAALVNDEPCGAVSVPTTLAGSPPQPIGGTTVGATTSSQPGVAVAGCAPGGTPRDAWFVFTPLPGTSVVTLNFTGTSAGAVRVFTSLNCSAGPFALVTCQNSGLNSGGINSMVFSIPQAPNVRYYVAVSDYGSADPPGTFTIASTNTVTAAQAQVETNALLVFPNPSNTGELTLRLTAMPSAGQVVLLNALGQQVLHSALTANKTEQILPTGGLAAGVYTLRITMGNRVLTRKVVLQN